MKREKEWEFTAHQQIDVRPRTVSQNPERRRQAVVCFVCVHRSRLGAAFSLPGTALWLVLLCLSTPRFWEFQKSRKTRAAFISSNCPEGGGKKSLQFSCQWVLLRRRPSIKRLTEPARRIASTTHWGSAGTQLFECNSSNQHLFKDCGTQQVWVQVHKKSSAREPVKPDGARSSDWALASRRIKGRVTRGRKGGRPRAPRGRARVRLAAIVSIN